LDFVTLSHKLMAGESQINSKKDQDQKKKKETAFVGKKLCLLMGEMRGLLGRPFTTPVCCPVACRAEAEREDSHHAAVRAWPFGPQKQERSKAA
jgi:hypothetical protein